MSAPREEAAAARPLNEPEATASGEKRYRSRYRPTAFAVTALTAVICTIVLVKTTDIFPLLLTPFRQKTASALFMVGTHAPRVLNDSAQPWDELEFATFKKTQETLITSRFVLQAALRNPKVGQLPSVRAQHDPVDWLSKKLTVMFSGELMRVSLSGTDPVEVTELLNGVVDAYLREVVNVARNRRRASYSSVKDVYAKLLDSLKSKRELVLQLEGRTRSGDSMAADDEFAAEIFTDIRREQRRVRNALVGIEARLARRKGKNPVSNELKPSADELEDELASLRAQEAALSEEASTVRGRLAERSGTRAATSPVHAELTSLERVVARVGETVDSLGIEISAPERVLLLERAEVPR